MTGPTDGGDDWDFPEVDPADPVSPASTALPEPEPETVYDTGSDAWWRAQAAAQREAAATEEPGLPGAGPAASYVAPEPEPALVEPQVLIPVTDPLDRAWLPAELAEPIPAEPDTGPEPERPYVPPLADAPAAAEPAPEQEPRERPVADTAPVGPLRALAGAGLAVAGVALGIGALLVFTHDDQQGDPVVASPPSATASAPATSAPPLAPTTDAPSAPVPPSSAAPVAPAAPSATPLTTPPATARPVAPVVQVSVLNNSRRTGLADRSAARFRAGGWPVRTTGNYSGGTIAQTTVYYAPGQQASALRFARQFGIPRVKPRFAGIPTSGMTVIVTRDYA